MEYQQQPIYQQQPVYQQPKSQFTGGLLGLIGINILMGLLTGITLGIYGFWLEIKFKQWLVKHTHLA